MEYSNGNPIAWYVAGDPDAGFVPFLWQTKLDAEQYARECFPNENPERRYARLYYLEIQAYEPLRS